MPDGVQDPGGRTVGAGRPGTAARLSAAGLRSLARRLGMSPVGSMVTIDVVLLACLLLVALALRLERLPELVRMGPDQARDALLVHRALDSGQLMLQGPVSIGGFYRGPAWYYMLIPAYGLLGPHPMSGALVSVLLDLAAMTMLFVVGRAWISSLAGLVAAGLWAVSPVVLEHARFAWNMDPVAVLTLACLYSLWRMARGDPRWFVLLVPTYVVAWQAHEQVLMLGPLLAVGVVLARPRPERRELLLAGSAGIIILLPFLVQQWRVRGRDLVGQLRNVLGMQGGPPGPESPAERLPAAMGRLEQIVRPVDDLAWILGLVAVVGLAIIALRIRRHGRASPAGWLLLAGYSGTVLLYVFWRAPILLHYLVVVCPVPFLLIGVAADAAARGGSIAALGTRLALAGVVMFGAGASIGTIRTLEPRATSASILQRTIDVALQKAGPGPYAVSTVVADLPHDAYDAPWLYHFALASHLPESHRVDVPTVVVYEAASLAAPDAPDLTVVGPSAVARFPAPAMDVELLVDADFRALDVDRAATLSGGRTSDGWIVTTPGSATVETTTEGPMLRLSSIAVNDSVNAAQNVPVEPQQRYLMRFETTSDARVGEPRVYVELLDASGTVLGTEPNGGSGWFAPRRAGWIAGSFYVDAPEGTVAARVFLRDRAAGSVWFRAVSLRRVLPPLVPPWRPNATCCSMDPFR